jgi:transcriptional regulator with XRE-family HTH domain
MAIGGERVRSDQLEKALGERVRNARFSLTLTQAEVAERANVSIGALKHLESGSGATVRTLVKVLRALGQEDWFGALAPETAGFNPLDLLTAQETERGLARPRRVRRPRTDVP